VVASDGFERALQSEEAMRALNRAQFRMGLNYAATIAAGVSARPLVAIRLHLWLALTIAAVLPAEVTGQLPEIPELPAPSQEPDGDLSRLYSERRVVKHLKDLTLAGRKLQVHEVRDFLAILRAADPMLMVPDPRGVYVPLHRDLTVRIQKLGEDSLEEIRHENVAAETALQRTLAEESYRGLIPFLHRYAGTNASLQAHLLLATVHRDRGNSLAAEFWLAPLFADTVDPEIKAAAEKLNASLTALEKVEASENVTAPAAGSQPSSDPAAPASDDSTAASGSATPDTNTQPTVADAMPADAPTSDVVKPAFVQQYVRWTQSLPLPMGAGRQSRDLVQGAVEYGLLPWTAWAPVIDQQQVFIRTPYLVAAYDRQTGKHAWTRTLQQQQELIEEVDDDLPGFRMRLDEGAMNSALNAPNIQLLHRNEIIGRMTSDSERLFAVVQLGETVAPSPREENFRLRAVMGQADVGTAGTWELVAIEKATGRRLWTTGGPPVEEKFGNELAMSWFAGPPAVSGQELYQVVERNGAVQLVCLKASTGQVRWTLPLGYPDIDIAQDPARQLLAAQTYAKSGLIFTTTTTGWVFAIDSLTQSVQWARRLPAIPGNESRVRSFRNPTFLQTPLQPMGQVWRSQTPVLAANALVLASAESHQLMVLDPRSGKVRLKSADFGGSKTDRGGKPGRASSEDNATVVIYADQMQFVVASPNSIVSCRLSDLQKLWTVHRRMTEAVPVGPAVRSADDLLIPLSDGSLEVIGLADGQVKTSLKGLRPPFSSGGLFSAGDDIISYGPNHLALLALSSADRSTDSDALQQAQFLLETGHVAEARTALAQVHLHPLNRESVRRLRFRIALGAFTAEAVPGSSRLEELETQAETPEEKALAQYLRLEYLRKTSPATLSLSLINALQEDDAVQQVEIPDAAALQKMLQISTTENPLELSSLNAGHETLRYPFRSWVLQQLRRQVGTADREHQAEIVRSCAQLSDNDLLEMQSREFADEYLRRAEDQLATNRLSESTVQLLIAAADFAHDAGKSKADGGAERTVRVATAFEKAEAIAQVSSAHDPAHRLLMQRLLQVVRYELQATADGSSLPAPADSSERLADRWSSEADTQLTMLPVSTTGQMAYRTPPVVPVDVALQSDPVLSAFHWSFRRTPGALLCQPVNDRAVSPWMLKVSGAENPFLQSEEELYRFGSIIILQNMTGLSAFSVTDQRWLWTRTMPGIMGRRANRMLNRPFQDYHGAGDAPFLSNYGRRLCGGSHRWLCVVSEGTLEVLDVMTGNRLWAVNGLKLNSSAFVCRNAICISGLDETPVVVDPMDGSVISTSDSGQLPDLLRRTMHGSPDALVVWNPPTSTTTERTVTWVDPLTADVIQTVPLPDMEWAQFLDGETLAAVTGDQRCHVLNLRTRKLSTISFAGEGDSAATELLPQQIAVAADPVNFYVFERQENAMVMAGSMYGIRGEPVQKELRAVNRRTGKLAWIRRAQGNTMACIEGTESVMLILAVTGQPRANAAAIPGLALQAGQRYVIEGVARTTGVRRLIYPVVSQIPFPSLRLSSNATGQLDLEAFGNRVRFFIEPDAAKP